MNYAFGSFQLFARRRLLLADGEQVRLGARAFDLLVALAEHSGEVVSKERLLEHAWPNVTVDDVALRVHLSALRKALQAGGLGNSPISNVPGRGYVLTAPVHALHDEGYQPRATASPLARLPSSGKRLIGREGVVDIMASKLRSSRVLSVVGPGGIGKTSVAVLFAEVLAERYPDGVYFVDLAILSQTDSLWTAIANAAGLAIDTIDTGDSVRTVLQAFLGKRALLILDNCEHLIDQAAVVADYCTRELPSLDMVATSREPLHASGEQVYRLPALDMPSEILAAEGRDYSAVRLLVDRAAASNDAFVLRDGEVEEAVRLCRRLDGLPLAIEFVAASIGTFGIKTVAARLDDWFLPALRGPRGASPRHQTLTSVLDWSFDLLSKKEQWVLMQLAIFQGSFDLPMAIGLLSCAQPVSASVLEAVHHLHDKSLISADLSGDEIEYRLLETTRSYAREKLQHSGEQQGLARRHAEVLVQIVAEADVEWDVSPRSGWLRRYGPRLADLRAALRWALSDAGDPNIAARCMTHGLQLWLELGLQVEIYEHVAAFLKRVQDGVEIEPQLEMRLKLDWAGAWTARGTKPEMLEVGEQGLALAEKLNAPIQKMQAYWLLWNKSTITGCFDEALTARIADLANSSHDPMIQLAGLRLLGLTLHYQGDQGAAWRLQKRIARYSDTIFDKIRRIGNYGDQRLSHITLEARLLWMLGYPEQALAAAERGIARSELSGSGPRAYFLGFAACPVALWSGNKAVAEQWIGELVQIASRYDLVFWQNLAEVYRQILDRLEAESEEPGSALPPDADRHYQLNQLQLFASFHPGFAASSVIRQCDTSDMGWCRSEALRSQALMLSATEAEHALERAIDVARAQSALSWELRAATSLARLLKTQGRNEEAAQKLGRVYGQFTEGFETLDLRKAKALLPI